MDVDLTASLNEGAQYKVSQLTWTGSPVLSTKAFADSADLKPGAVASARELRNTLHAVEVAYSAQGYLQAQVTAPPQFDRAAHTVAYTVAVDPGPQYHLRTIRWSGLTDAQTQNLQSRFKMQPGAVFDATYPLTFIRQNSTQVPSGTKPGFEIHAIPGDHTVDLIMSFSPRS